MKGMAPGVIGVLAVSLGRLARAALPDPFAIAILVAIVAVLLKFRVDAFKLMIVGAVLGVLRSRLPSKLGSRALEHLVTLAGM